MWKTKAPSTDARRQWMIERSTRVPDAVQRVSDAPQIRNPASLGLSNRDPGSAAHRSTLRCAREKWLD
jgi:hypothetical protein